MKRSRNTKDQSGRLLVELVLIFPILFSLVFVTFELVRYVRSREALAIYVEEVGKAVYRSCSDFLEEPRTAGESVISASNNRTSSCLVDLLITTSDDYNRGYSKVWSDLAKSLNIPLPTIRISIFDRADLATASGQELFLVGGGTAFTGVTNYPSKFTTNFSSWPIKPSSFFTSRKKRIVVVEVTFPSSGMFIFAKALGLAGSTSSEIYDAIIL